MDLVSLSSKSLDALHTSLPPSCGLLWYDSWSYIYYYRKNKTVFFFTVTQRLAGSNEKAIWIQEKYIEWNKDKYRKKYKRVGRRVGKSHETMNVEECTAEVAWRLYSFENNISTLLLTPFSLFIWMAQIDLLSNLNPKSSERLRFSWVRLENNDRIHTVGLHLEAPFIYWVQ